MNQVSAATAYALSKWEDIKQGQRVIISDESLDALIDELHARPTEDPDAMLFFGNFVSIPNPKRVGIRDAYIGYLK